MNKLTLPTTPWVTTLPTTRSNHPSGHQPRVYATHFTNQIYFMAFWSGSLSYARTKGNQSNDIINSRPETSAGVLPEKTCAAPTKRVPAGVFISKYTITRANSCVIGRVIILWKIIIFVLHTLQRTQ